MVLRKLTKPIAIRLYEDQSEYIEDNLYDRANFVRAAIDEKIARVKS